ncbi:DUF3231 family protein [Priestia aryabhattai]|uniref:DUF3231 family protein n=1 Tax=Priestia aryabhattai TaxID=412384 RepID=UPI001C0E5148|nr:DUF3231 family protein [Priestia aryabhattai]MBU3573262.1 DUF3231 family protein [Priestia aryabhattai]WDL86231.1 DUF3231 family protein [Priestia aryabhattai]
MQKNHIDLTSAEISCLWSSYLADSMFICVFKYFIQHIKDEEIKNLVEHALDLSQQHVEIIQGIFKTEEIAIPQGFTDQDINLKAKSLFTDNFCLFYVKNMAEGGLMVNGDILPNIYREDIYSFYSKCLTSTLELHGETTQLLLEKGLAVRPPKIPKPEKVEFIHKQSFLFEFLGERRPLTGQEVTHLYSNMQTNAIGAAIASAFTQVSSSKKIREHVKRGKDILEKHTKVMNSYLESYDLPVPISYEDEITTSEEAPFSEKLMVFHIAMNVTARIGIYGISISQSQRSDLTIDYSRLLTEIIAYGEDGLNIMIDKEWVEKPPMAADRKKLRK